MKYIWIIMLAIIEVFMWIYTVFDIIVSYKMNDFFDDKTERILETIGDLNGLTIFNFAIHIVFLFMSSVCMYIMD